MANLRLFSLLIVIMMFSFGCASLQPTRYDRPTDEVLPWKNFEKAMTAANEIEVGKTTLQDLKQKGFDPERIPNTKRILDVRKELLPNNSSTVEELPTEQARLCYKKVTKCVGYKFNVKITRDQGFGNTFLRMVNVKKEVSTTGWEFEFAVYLLPREDANIATADEQGKKELVVVFGLFGGTSNIQNKVTTVNKLGWVGIVLGAGSQFSPIKIPQVNTE